MKKIMFFGLVILAGLSGFAAEVSKPWVVVNKGKLECEKLNIGISKARMVLANGEKTKIQVNNILAYSISGKIFMRKPLYANGKPTGKMAFMELIKTRGNLSLYRYVETFGLNSNIYSIFVFDKDRMLLTVDEKTMPNISEVFGVNFSLQ